MLQPRESIVSGLHEFRTGIAGMGYSPSRSVASRAKEALLLALAPDCFPPAAKVSAPWRRCELVMFNAGTARDLAGHDWRPHRKSGQGEGGHSALLRIQRYASLSGIAGQVFFFGGRIRCIRICRPGYISTSVGLWGRQKKQKRIGKVDDCNAHILRAHLPGYTGAMD